MAEIEGGMDGFIKSAFDSIKKIGVDLKHCKIGNIEAADKICEILEFVCASEMGKMASEAARAIRKEFEV